MADCRPGSVPARPQPSHRTSSIGNRVNASRQIQPALVQGPADDAAGQPEARPAGERRPASSRRPRRSPARHGGGQLGQRLQVRPFQHAVAADVGVDDGGQRPSRALRGPSPGADMLDTSSQPSVATGRVRASMPSTTRPGKRRQTASNQAGILQGPRAEDDALDAPARASAMSASLRRPPPSWQGTPAASTMPANAVAVDGPACAGRRRGRRGAGRSPPGPPSAGPSPRGSSPKTVSWA